MRNVVRCVGAALAVAAVCWALGGAAPAKAAEDKQGTAASADESKSYYESLMDLVVDRRGNPKPKTEEQLVIDPPKGAIGVAFGQSMDEVVAVWGKPEWISMERGMPKLDWTSALKAMVGKPDGNPLFMQDEDPVIRLSYKGGLRFRFRNNKLFQIWVIGLDGVHFKDGPALNSTPDEVKTALGEPGSVEQRSANIIEWNYKNAGVAIQLTFYDSKLGVVTLEVSE